MKKNTRSHLTARVALATLLIFTSVGLVAAIPMAGHAAQHKNKPASLVRPTVKPPIADLPGTGPMPASGSINATDTSPVTWVGTTVSPGGNVNTESTCMDNSPVNGCETFTLT